MLCLVVSLHIKPEHLEEFIAAQLDMAKKVLSEPGCLRYDVLQHNEDPTLFHRYEVYRDEDAFSVGHASMQHTKDFGELTRPWWAEPLSFFRTTNLYPSDQELGG